MPIYVIAGTKKGRKLNTPKVLEQTDRQFETKPMTDTVKSAIFSVLQEFTPNAEVLDLFAGSGALGIEALSRGARFATFIDISKNATAIIAENLRNCELTNRSNVITDKAMPFVQDAYDERELFSLIFISPPWKVVGNHILKECAHILTDKGVIIAEHPLTYDFEDEVGELIRADKRKYGKTIVSFFVKRRR